MKAVIVPTTGDLKGIETSAILGAVGGNAEKKLEVLVDVTDEDLKITRELLKKKICHVELLEGVSNLQIIVELKAGEDTALAEIAFFPYEYCTTGEKRTGDLFQGDGGRQCSFHRQDTSESERYL